MIQYTLSENNNTLAFALLYLFESIQEAFVVINSSELFICLPISKG